MPIFLEARDDDDDQRRPQDVYEDEDEEEEEEEDQFMAPPVPWYVMISLDVGTSALHQRVFPHGAHWNVVKKHQNHAYHVSLGRSRAYYFPAA